jgi:hypothetical protein
VVQQGGPWEAGGELTDGGRVVDVPAECDLFHDQVVADQKLRRPRIVHAEAPGPFGRSPRR